MKVVHICYSDSGGAANAAIRLHIGLLKQGVKSQFLCARKSNKNIPELEIIQLPLSLLGRIIKNATECLISLPFLAIKRPQITSFINELLQRVFRKRTQLNKNKRLLKNKSLEVEIFSFPKADFDLLSHSSIKNADIVHLHWVSSFLDWPTFFYKINKPIVWTLHDMNPILGGFHYLNDKEKNYPNVKEIEDKFERLKINSIPNDTNLTIVGVSEWLKKESENSKILGRFPHKLIPYGLPMDIFKPVDKKVAKAFFNLPANKKIILFAAYDITNIRKGAHLLFEALRELDQTKTHLAIIGNINSSNSISNSTYMGFIKDERLMALAYSAADLFVIPSLEDNLPNTVLESLACGTPVVGFNIGGIPDMIIPGLNGLIAQNTSAKSLALKITESLNIKFSQEAIRNDALKRFAEEIQAKRYMNLYNSILF
jgi:glycosyltransferase involved in cell wall biosynthesis